MKRVFQLASMATIFAVYSVLVISCSQNTQRTMYHAGEVSKATAESAYKAIYRASKEGKVTEEDLARANQAYDKWAALQSVYVRAAMTAESSNLYDLVNNLQKQLDQLMGIAVKYQLL